MKRSYPIPLHSSFFFLLLPQYLRINSLSIKLEKDATIPLLLSRCYCITYRLSTARIVRGRGNNESSLKSESNVYRSRIRGIKSTVAVNNSNRSLSSYRIVSCRVRYRICSDADFISIPDRQIWKIKRSRETSLGIRLINSYWRQSEACVHVSVCASILPPLVYRLNR